MLDEARKKFITASQAHRVMAGFELELAGRNMEKPAISDETMKHFKSLDAKPKVGDLKALGMTLTGAEINDVWAYIRATRPVFSEGMETVAMEIAMGGFLSDDYEAPEGYKSEDMENGNINEGEAVAALSVHTGIEFTAIEDGQKFLSKGNLGVTPDGVQYDGFDIVSCAEVKNPKDSTHFKYLYLMRNGGKLIDVMPQYYWQCQCGLSVTGANDYHWASYHSGFKESYRLVYEKVEPNQEHIDLLKERAAKVLARADEIRDGMLG